MSDAPPNLAPSTPTDPFASFGTSGPAVVRSVGIAAGAYAAAWLFGLVLILLVRLGVQDDPVPWSWLVTAPGQLTAMSVFSPLSFGTSGEEFEIPIAFTAAPLVVSAMLLGGVAWLSRRDEARSPTEGRGVLALAVVCGLTFALVAWLIALVLTPADEGQDGSAASWQTWIFGTVLVGAAALAGRRKVTELPALGAWPGELFAAVRAVAVHLGVFGVVSVPAAMVILAVDGEAPSILLIPLLLVNGIAFAASLGHLGALSLSTELFGGVGDSFSGTVWLFSDDVPRSLITFLPLAFVAWFAGALVLALRARGTTRGSAGWVCTPLVYAVAGGAICLLPRIWVSAGGFGTSVGPAAWFFLVFAAWGLAAEAASRSVAPMVAERLPHGLATRLHGTPRERTTALSAPVSVSAEPTSRRTKVLVGTGAGLLVALVAGFIAVSVVSSTRFSPEREAEAYFEAVAAGRADDALDHARLSVKSSDRVLLTDEILKASKDRIEDVSIGDVTVHGGEATATARFTLEGAEISADLTLVKDGSRWGLFDRWVVDDPGLGTIYLTAPGAESLRVNGVDVPVDGLGDGVTLPAFPGTYVIEPSAGSMLVSYGSETVTVAGDQDLEFEAMPSAEMKQKVTSAALAFLRQCLKTKEADPDGCPNETFYSDLSNVSWKLVEEPTFTVESDFEGGFQFSTEDAGTAKITATEEPLFDGEPSTPYDEEVSIDFGGSVHVDGTEVTIEVDDTYF